MVSIFTYRDERKLFALVGAVIVAAAIALVQILSVRSGRPSPIAVAVGTIGAFFESGVTGVTSGVRSGFGWVAALPHLAADDADLRAQVHALKLENRRLQEQLAEVPEAQSLERAKAHDPAGVAATVVGYDPEDAGRTATIDRGARSGIARDAGVVTDEGVVGRVASVTPFGATIRLLTDADSSVPAVVQRGRWWGIATGLPQSDGVAVEYVSQDAKVRTGDLVVTGEGRSFHAGYPIGRVAKIFHPEGALYQTLILTPAIRFARLHGVLVLPGPSAATP